MNFCIVCDEPVEPTADDFGPTYCEPCNDEAVDRWCSGGAEAAAEAADIARQREKMQMYDAGRLVNYPY